MTPQRISSNDGFMLRDSSQLRQSTRRRRQFTQDSSYSDMYRHNAAKKLGKSLDSEEKELKKCE